MKNIIKIMLLLSVTGLYAADMADQAMDDTSIIDMSVDNQEQNQDVNADSDVMLATDQSVQDQDDSNQAMNNEAVMDTPVDNETPSLVDDATVMVDTAQDNAIVAAQDAMPVEVAENQMVKTVPIPEDTSIGRYKGGIMRSCLGRGNVIKFHSREWDKQKKRYLDSLNAINNMKKNTSDASLPIATVPEAA